MPTGPTPRQLARSENIDRIKRLALAQLADAGASELSLRAIARELNLVSSAIYRYYASRDELITALIIDAYDDLADHLEAAGRRTARKAPRRRWIDTCHSVREWALTQPHRFALIYGSAIPGYQAPPDTIGAAARVVRAFCAPVVGATPAPDVVPLGRVVRRQLVTTGDALEFDVSPEVMLLVIGAFARVVGLLTLELNGHFVGGFEPADALFDALVTREADALGA